MVDTRQTWRVMVSPELRLRGGFLIFTLVIVECIAASALIWGPQVRVFDTTDYVMWWATALVFPLVVAVVIAYPISRTRARANRAATHGRVTCATVRGASVLVRDGVPDWATHTKFGKGWLTVSSTDIALWSETDPDGPALTLRRDSIAKVEVLRALPWLGGGPMLGILDRNGLRVEVVLAFGTIWDLFGSRIKDVAVIADSIADPAPTGAAPLH
ncbi:hypothetical protein [Microbacterium rhizomatis]|uniref:Uncharacterized protein n=1 Tax=Microbacterium rhizomatis TaxID=1631477 RepID=A0A5J5J0B3_9MICO|nr:hypothetical protein [Microbacterium rhizomatis]KAA9107955.1 hypothetical protein F6B43_11055 [Microbacterium rhizomatis]